MKFALFLKTFALLLCIIFSEITFSQTSQPVSEPFSLSSPFDPPDPSTKKDQQNDVIYDTTNVSIQEFVDILSSPQTPFSTNQINNHSTQTVDDPGKDCDAPIDNNILVLFITAVCFRLRHEIKGKFKLIAKRVF